MVQQIEQPLGVTAFGSHMLRVNPDFAILTVAVTRMAAEPAVAFHEARAAAEAVRRFLSTRDVADREVRASQVTLRTTYSHSPRGARVFSGHQAGVTISVSVSDLVQVEALLVGMVEAGADEVKSVLFKTSQLREHRAAARAGATRAARAKAEVYCEAAGVKLGKVLHIEDVDPTRLRGREYGHVVDEDFDDSSDNDPGAYDPGAITVSGAAIVSFAIL